MKTRLEGDLRHNLSSSSSLVITERAGQVTRQGVAAHVMRVVFCVVVLRSTLLPRSTYIYVWVPVCEESR